jgi:hypothetical protein
VAPAWKAGACAALRAVGFLRFNRFCAALLQRAVAAAAALLASTLELLACRCRPEDSIRAAAADLASGMLASSPRPRALLLQRCVARCYS